MDNNKWYEKLLFVLAVALLLLPVCICLFVWVVIEFCKRPMHKKQYRASAYYQDLQLPYRNGILHRSAYGFYNEAKKAGIPFEFVHRNGDGYEYVVRDNTVYLFPEFEELGYDDLAGQWKVDLDGDEWSTLEDELRRCTQQLEGRHRACQVCFLVEEACLVPRGIFREVEPWETDWDNADYALELLPDCICWENTFWRHIRQQCEQ